LIKLKSIEASSLQKLKRIKHTKLKETTGLYDFYLLLITTLKNDLDKVVGKLNKQFGNKLINLDIVEHPLEDTLGYKSFCNNYQLMTQYKILNPMVKDINSAEEKIIVKLSDNPSISLKDLAKKVKISVGKCGKIVKQLVANEIIRFSVDPYYNNLGLEFHNLLLRINPGYRQQFESKIIRHPRVHWMKRSNGRWDYILSICSRNMAEYIDVCRDIRTENQDTIFEVSSLISKVHKHRII